MRISYWSSDVCSSDLDLVVEAVLTEQQLVDALEEHPGLRTLADAVVVGRRDRDDLRQAEVGQRLGVGGLHLGRPGDGPAAHRSEARSGGTACGSTCRSRWCTYRSTIKLTI